MSFICQNCRTQFPNPLSEQRSPITVVTKRKKKDHVYDEERREVRRLHTQEGVEHGMQIAEEKRLCQECAKAVSHVSA
jgi:DNA topoisomerase VI subunit A